MYEYGLPQGNAQGQASTSSPGPSMQPPSSSSDFRNGHLQQQQQQQPQQPYPYGYDSYPPPVGQSSYDYGFQRGQMQSGMDGMPGPYGNGNGSGNASGNWESPYNGASSSSHDRSREQPPWMMGDGNGMYGQMGMHGDMSRGNSGAIDGNGNGHGHGNGHGGAGLGLGGDEESWRRNGTGWGNDYGKSAVPDAGVQKDLETLRYNINDLVESIRPYAVSPNNPRPPKPPPYAQQRFVRLAASIRSALSTLQPHMHPLLHPEFLLTPPKPRSSPSNGPSNGGPSSSIKPLSSAEEEMEVIRKRRDMLIARAAQVTASQQQQPQSQQAQHSQQQHSQQQHAPSPNPLNQNPSGLYSQHHHIQTPPQQHHHMQSQQYPFSHMQSQNVFQLQPSWNHTDMYGNGGLYNSNPMSLSTSNGGSPFNIGAALAPFDDNTNINSRRSTMDTFDPDLARFSLDPAKIPAYPEKVSKKSQPEGGKCHGCSVTVTAEWRRGPDGPRSLCNACGLHYAKLTRKRAQEDALVKSSQTPAAPAS